MTGTNDPADGWLPGAQLTEVRHNTADAPALRAFDKVVYGVGAIPFGVKDAMFTSFLLLFYNQVIGLPASLVGIAIMVALVVDAVADPIIGYVSDGWRSSWGRRHPFMYVSAIPMAVAFAMLWNPPTGWSEPALLAYLIVTTIAVRTLVTMYEIPSAALMPELTTDYGERTSLLSYRLMMALLGGLGMGVVAYTFFLQPTAEHPVGQLNPQGYSRLAVAAAAIMLLSVLISAVGTHRRIPFLHVEPASHGLGKKNFRREIVTTLSDRSFLAVLIAALLVAAGSGLANSLNLYFMSYFWEMPISDLALLLAPLALGGLAASAIAAFLTRTVGKARGMSVVLFAGMLVMALPIGLRLVGFFPPNGSTALLGVLLVDKFLSAAMHVSAMILAGAIIADLAEQSEIKTGRRIEGLLFALFSLVMKSVSGIGIFAAGTVLALVAFPPNATPGHVAQETVARLGLVYVSLVVVIFGAAAAIVTACKSDRATHESNLRELAARRGSA